MLSGHGLTSEILNFAAGVSVITGRSARSSNSLIIGITNWPSVANIYFESFPVAEKQVARTLAANSAWEVLEQLRQAGISGLTAEEISAKLELPKSSVYNVLAKLQAAGWVEPRRATKRLGRPDERTRGQVARTGRTKQLYVEKIPWGGYVLNEEFDDVLGAAVERMLADHRLPEAFADALDKTILALTSDEHGKDFLPSREPCPKCKTSHEANEFVMAIASAIMSELVEHERLEPTYKKHNLVISAQ